jgi:hypothetical protein
LTAASGFSFPFWPLLPVSLSRLGRCFWLLFPVLATASGLFGLVLSFSITGSGLISDIAPYRFEQSGLAVV